MIKLFTDDEYDSAKGYDFLPFQCEFCGKTFLQRKSKYIYYHIKRNFPNKTRFCSWICARHSRNKRITLTCAQCNSIFERKSHLEKMKYKSKNRFCSCSCSNIYNKHYKRIGARRSKLEIWIESQLRTLYPNLEILFNNHEIIGSELDIYFPSLKLAVELNGIYHYEPIHGQNKLEYVQNNDNRKLIACYEQNIELIIIDTMQMIHFKEHNAQKYLDIINNILFVKMTA